MTCTYQNLSNGILYMVIEFLVTGLEKKLRLTLKLKGLTLSNICHNAKLVNAHQKK